MYSYLDMLRRIKTAGKLKPNRTGVDTLGVSGYMFMHNMNDGFPLLTTKKMWPKSIFTELEFFIKGLRSKQWLKDRGCKIWNEWCNPQKIPKGLDEEAKKEFQLNENDLGEIYGVQWRNFDNSGLDQFDKMLGTLVKNPFDRRMIVSAWNPKRLDHMALPACHFQFQIISQDLETIDLIWSQR